MKTIKEMQEVLRGKSNKDAYKILWQWVKQEHITFKDFQELCKYIVQKELMDEDCFT